MSDPLFKRELRLGYEDYQPYRVRVGDTRADLSRIRCPTLVLAGEDDPQSPLAGAEEVAEAVPREALVGFHVFPRARHSLFRDAPEATVALVEFLRGLDGERG